MSITDNRLNRARIPFKIRTPEGNQEYQTRPLSDADMDEINAWIRSTYMERMEQSVANLTNEVMIKAAAEAALRVVATLDMMDGGQGSRMIACIDGLSRVLWQSMRDDHPELTHAELKRLLLVDPENASRGADHWQSVNMGATKQSPGEGQSRNARRRAAQKRKKSTGH